MNILNRFSPLVLILGIWCCSSPKEQSSQASTETNHTGLRTLIASVDETKIMGVIYYDDAYHLYYTKGSDEWGVLRSENLFYWNAEQTVSGLGSSSGAVLTDPLQLTGLEAQILILYKEGASVKLKYSKDGASWIALEKEILSLSGAFSISWDAKNKWWILTEAVDTEVRIYTSVNLQDWTEHSTLTYDFEIQEAALFQTEATYLMHLKGHQTEAYQLGTFDDQQFLGGKLHSHFSLNSTNARVIQAHTDLLWFDLTETGDMASLAPAYQVVVDSLSAQLFPHFYRTQTITAKRRARLEYLLSDGPSWYTLFIEDEFESLSVQVKDSLDDGIRIQYGSDALVLEDDAGEKTTLPLSVASLNDSENRTLEIIIDQSAIDFIFFGKHARVMLEKGKFYGQVELYLDGTYYNARAILHDITIRPSL